MKSAVGLVLVATVLGAMGLQPTQPEGATGKDSRPNVQHGSPEGRQNDVLVALLNRSDKTCRASLSLVPPVNEELPFNSFGECLMTSWGTKDDLGTYFIEVWAQPALAADGSRSVRLVNKGNLSAVVELAGQLAIIDGGFGFKVFQIPKAEADSSVKLRTTFYSRSWSGRELVPPSTDAK